MIWMVWNETCNEEEGERNFILQQLDIQLYDTPEIGKVPEDTEFTFSEDGNQTC